MHRSISHSILDDVEDVAQEPLTPTEETFTPTLPDIHMEQECTPTEPDLSITEVDSQSEGSVESDSLLKLAQMSPKTALPGAIQRSAGTRIVAAQCMLVYL